jgi:uncharacterized protein YceK
MPLRTLRPLALALAALSLPAGLSGCKSTAPHTGPAMAINTALAATVAAVSVASGGCVAVCTNGLVCNPKSGLCEKPPDFKCLGPDPATGLCDKRPEDMNAARAAESRSSTLPASLGISPATGSVPPPPAESSPKPFTP